MSLFIIIILLHFHTPRRLARKDGRQNTVGMQVGLTFGVAGWTDEQGISLPMEQFSALIQTLPHIEMVLKGYGEEMERPMYEEGSSEGLGMGNSKNDEKPDVAPKEDSNRRKKRKNFEATSDEGESDD